MTDHPDAHVDESVPPSPPREAPSIPAAAPTRQSINAAAFAAGVFLTVVLTKLVSYLTPYKLYFSFSSFLYSDRGLFRWEALTIKLLIPAIVGFLLYYVPFQWMRVTAGSRISYRTLYRYLALQADASARATGFFAAVLLAWPFIVYWDILQSPALHDQRFAFFCVYLLYFVAYTYFASLGVHLAKLSVRRHLPSKVTRDATRGLGWLDAVRTSVLGIVTSAIATYFASRLGGAP